MAQYFYVMVFVKLCLYWQKSVSVKSFDGFAFANDYCKNFERAAAKNKPQHEQNLSQEALPPCSLFILFALTWEILHSYVKILFLKSKLLFWRIRSFCGKSSCQECSFATISIKSGQGLIKTLILNYSIEMIKDICIIYIFDLTDRQSNSGGTIQRIGKAQRYQKTLQFLKWNIILKI